MVVWFRGSRHMSSRGMRSSTASPPTWHQVEGARAIMAEGEATETPISGVSASLPCMKACSKMLLCKAY